MLSVLFEVIVPAIQFNVAAPVERNAYKMQAPQCHMSRAKMDTCVLSLNPIPCRTPIPTSFPPFQADGVARIGVCSD